MKGIIILVYLLPLIFIHSAIAEESIKVLMLQGTKAVLPSEDAKSLGRVNGKIIFNGHTYTGRLEVKSDGNGLYIINDLPLERYIEGVVASESGEDWELEALKAQAVISRTYALYNREIRHQGDYHITSSVRDQVYEERNADPLISRAVKETEGEILIYNNRPIKAYYHSICIGKTEVPEEVWGEAYPYLKSVDCNAKNTPYDSWQRQYNLKDLEEAIGITGIENISIGSYTITGRVKTLKIIIKDSSPLEIRATELRRLLGYKRLPSTDFSIRIEDGKVVFDGRGWGHGVGLCQWGAFEMARQGKDYREILEHYYPRTMLKQAKIIN
jgi:stage II sporulation protein D